MLSYHIHLKYIMKTYIKLKNNEIQLKIYEGIEKQS